MRTEIKAALVLGLFGILGAVIWGINSGRKSRVELPLDVSSADLDTSGKTTLASDFTKIDDDSDSNITPPPAREDPPATIGSPVNEPNIAAGTGGEAAPDPIATRFGDNSDTTLPSQVETDKPVTNDDDPFDPDEPVSTGNLAAPIVNDAPVDTPVVLDEPLVPDPGGNSRLSALSTSPSTDTTYTIQPGDTFISIARERFGHDKYWKAIQAANPELEATRLREDQPIKLPSAEQIAAVDRTSSTPANVSTPSERGASGPERRLYIVEPGDTLTAIARKLLEDESRWDEIYDLNTDKLSSPDKIVDGVELRIPEKAG